MDRMTTLQTHASMTHRRVLKVVAWLALCAVMAVGFVGYLMPGVSLSWDTLVSLCGF